MPKAADKTKASFRRPSRSPTNSRCSSRFPGRTAQGLAASRLPLADHARHPNAGHEAGRHDPALGRETLAPHARFTRRLRRRLLTLHCGRRPMTSRNASVAGRRWTTRLRQPRLHLPPRAPPRKVRPTELRTPKPELRASPVGSQHSAIHLRESSTGL